jgi:hypothetical protein
MGEALVEPFAGGIILKPTGSRYEKFFAGLDAARWSAKNCRITPGAGEV